MPTENLFESLDPAAPSVSITLDGTPLRVPANMSLAAALLASGVGHFRESPVNGRHGAPYCLMGACFECLLEVDGEANRQSCLIPVRSGMQVNRQRGAAGSDRPGETNHGQ